MSISFKAGISLVALPLSGGTSFDGISSKSVSDDAQLLALRAVLRERTLQRRAHTSVAPAFAIAYPLAVAEAKAQGRPWPQVAEDPPLAEEDPPRFFNALGEL